MRILKIVFTLFLLWVVCSGILLVISDAQLDWHWER